MVNSHVFFNFCHDLSQNMHVTRNGLHVSQLSCNACKLFFMLRTRIIICVLHKSKKNASNALCAACKSVFLCAACKLTAIFCQRRIKAYNEKAPQQNVIKCMDTKKMIFCLVFTYWPLATLDDVSSNQLNAKHDNGTRFRQHRH